MSGATAQWPSMSAWTRPGHGITPGYVLQPRTRLEAESIASLTASGIDPRRFQPALPSPGGLDRDAILSLFKTISIDGNDSPELGNYAAEDIERFLQTFGLVPPGATSIFEIGGNPYFMSLLLKWFVPDAALEISNYFGGKTAQRSQTVIVNTPWEERREYEFPYLNINIEDKKLPYRAGSFDCVLFCEVIEHLTNDPQYVLEQIWRLLQPGGHLILTTPNVARLENVARLVSGTNMYDPYSGYGPYGRHNREYTKHELWMLLQHCGFRPDVFYTADVHENRFHHFFDNLVEMERMLLHRAADLGQYHITRWVKVEERSDKKLSWLYRSYPEDECV